MIDGRWGASLLIDPSPEDPTNAAPPVPKGRPVPLLVYDLWDDPHGLHSLHEERPDLVEKYTKFLEAQWEAHQSLGAIPPGNTATQTHPDLSWSFHTPQKYEG